MLDLDANGKGQTIWFLMTSLHKVARSMFCHDFVNKLWLTYSEPSMIVLEKIH